MNKFLTLVIGCLLSTLFQAQQPVIWKNLAGVEYSPSNNKLEKWVRDSWSNAGAVSANELASNANGYFEYTLQSTDNKAIGFIDTFSSWLYRDIDYSFLINGGKIYIVENAAIVGSYGNAKVGAKFKIERRGAYIGYYVNGKLYRKVGANSSNALSVQCCIHKDEDWMSGVVCNFDGPFFQTAEINPIQENGVGSIIVTDHFGSGQTDVYWGKETVTEQDFPQYKAALLNEGIDLGAFTFDDIFGGQIATKVSVNPGRHWVRTIDGSDSESVRGYDLPRAIQALVLQNAEVSGSRIAKDGLGVYEGLLDAGITSYDEYAFVSFQVSNPMNEYFFGFRDIGQQNGSNGSQIRFGLRLDNKKVYLIDDYVQGGPISFQEGDIFSLEKYEDELSVFLNEQLLGVMQCPSSFAFFVDTFIESLYDEIKIDGFEVQGSSVKNPKYTVRDFSCNTGDYGSIETYLPANTPGNPSFTLSLNSVIVEQNTDGIFDALSPGLYSIVYSNGTESIQYDIEVATEIIWENLIGGAIANVSVDNNIGSTLFTPSSGSSNGQAISENRLFNEQAGWVEVRLRKKKKGSIIPENGNPGPPNTGELDVQKLMVVDEVEDQKFMISRVGNIYLFHRGAELLDALVEENVGRLRLLRTAAGVSGFLINNTGISPPVVPTFSAQHDGSPEDDFVMRSVGLNSKGNGMEKCRASFGCFVQSAAYQELSDRLEGQFAIVVNNKVYFEYLEQYAKEADSNLDFRVLNWEQNDLSSQMPAMPVVMGENLYALDVSALGLGTYILEVSNVKNEKWYLRFKK